jgi:phage gpG-like protein
MANDVRFLFDLSKRFRLLGLRRGYLTQEIAKTYADYARERFAAGTAPDGSLYPRLKSRPGKPFLGTSIERDATRPVVGIDSFKVIVKQKYGYVHMSGMTIYPRIKPLLSFIANGMRVFAKRVRIPQRPFVPTAGMPVIAEQRINKTIKDWMSGILNAK